MEALTPTVGWLFDTLLGIGLLWLAWQALNCMELFKAVVLFISFGLLMALAWVRLDAPDVALAEAAIGAGLTGALLLSALAKLRASTVNEKPTAQLIHGVADINYLRWLLLLTLLLMFAGLAHAILSLPQMAAGLSPEVTANLGYSGVSNPVTAVLLNYRGYDTLLEVFVLLLALLSVWSLGMNYRHHDIKPGLVLDTLSRLLAPMLVLVASYLLWIGATAPGGAFQAGSILGASGVLMILSGWRLHERLTGLPLRLVLISGPIAFIAIAALTLLFEGNLLEYPRVYAGTIILFLEITATFSIAATLIMLFLGGIPAKDKGHS